MCLQLESTRHLRALSVLRRRFTTNYKKNSYHADAVTLWAWSRLRGTKLLENISKLVVTDAEHAC